VGRFFRGEGTPKKRNVGGGGVPRKDARTSSAKGENELRVKGGQGTIWGGGPLKNAISKRGGNLEGERYEGPKLKKKKAAS